MTSVTDSMLDSPGPRALETKLAFTAFGFIAYLVAAALVTLLLIEAVNVWIDPLWYFGGNKLNGRNLIFDERISKALLFETLAPKPHCVLLGSSSGVYMHDADRIAEESCFNFAISFGHPEEFSAIAAWLADRGMSASKVILTIDANGLVRAESADPYRLRSKKDVEPPGFLVSYLSFRTFLFSLRTILNVNPRAPYYDANFQSQWPSPMAQFRRGVPHSYKEAERPFTPDRETAMIAFLRKLWPGVEVQCYIAPIEADFIADIDAKGLLEGFVESVSSLARDCDKFADFAIPSALTTDPTLTPDGTHYNPEANRMVADQLLLEGRQTKEAFAKMPPGEYFRIYKTALADAVGTQ